MSTLRSIDLRFVAWASAAGPLVALALWGASSYAGWALPTPLRDVHMLLWMCLLAPMIEELAFRGVLQDVMGAMRAWSGPLSFANVATSVAFAAVHVPSHGPVLAAAVFLPSLVFGRLKELSPSLLPAMALHGWYNACYLAVMGR
ncbi:MAG TPA: JDVT-CTERM system glutamic-type intramembrane protease [Ramlibacter sp.]|nr:JDVT-CTERM system glutamic-type intramembrane protease [Ramlibacter sp.]